MFHLNSPRIPVPKKVVVYILIFSISASYGNEGAQNDVELSHDLLECDDTDEMSVTGHPFFFDGIETLLRHFFQSILFGLWFVQEFIRHQICDDGTTERIVVHTITNCQGACYHFHFGGFYCLSIVGMIPVSQT